MSFCSPSPILLISPLRSAGCWILEWNRSRVVQRERKRREKSKWIHLCDFFFPELPIGCLHTCRKTHTNIMSDDWISAEWILYILTHLARLGDRIIEWRTVMKRKRWQHGGRPKASALLGFASAVCSREITLPLSPYQRNFTPYWAQFAGDHNAVGSLIGSADDVCWWTTWQRNTLGVKLAIFARQSEAGRRSNTLYAEQNPSAIGG